MKFYPQNWTIKLCYPILEADIQWRRARALREFSKINNKIGKKRKSALIYEALEAAEYAVKLDDRNWTAHKWYGIMLGDIGAQLKNIYCRFHQNLFFYRQLG